MGTDRAGMASPPLGFLREQLLHQGALARVVRLFDPGGGSVVCKRLLGSEAERRRRHEMALLERLAGVEGVVQLAPDQPDPESIMLVDVDGISLAERAKPLEVSELIGIAVGLARAVAAMHERRVVHRDICPANIVMAGDAAPFLIDFGLATTVAEIRPGFAPVTAIVGTLPYLAPEQTGRTGRPVDERADLYAVGATLYELATGDPPFGAGDPLRLIHDQLTRAPIPAAEVNPAVPQGLSAIITRLLAKEPDDRYQSAEGLFFDVAQLAEGGTRPLRLGERDFSLQRVLTPSRLWGREAEIAGLHSTFTDAVVGRCRGLLVSGAPGVGKSALVDELRPIVTANNGWFVMGKFDQYRRDQEFDGVYQAFRALGRLLLAEPEEELVELRTRLLSALGPNAGLLTAVVPEFATILQVPADVGDPLTAQVRTHRGAAQILRAVASRKRPVVFVVDDLQWAGRTPVGFLNTVFSGDEEIEGLLLVGAYREAEVDPTHPLAPMLARWGQQRVGPVQLRLRDLPEDSVAEIVADMLRLDPEPAAELAHLVTPRTHGNPYETIELLNALRQAGGLVPEAEGWRWDVSALREGDSAEVAELLGERIDATPPATRALLEMMACVAGRTELSLLQVAAGVDAPILDRWLAPALEQGLLVAEDGLLDAVRFRHDRVQEAVLGRLSAARERDLRLALARRLGARPELFAVAAEQYLPVIDAVREPDERHRVVTLLRHAADQAKLLSNHPLAERLLDGTVQLVDPQDTGVLVEVLTDRLTALYSLGRLDEADEVYHRVELLCTHPGQLTAALLVQVSSLINRGQLAAAVTLGVAHLRRLGLVVPAPERLSAEIDQRLDALHGWLEETSEADDLRRPEIADESLLATAVVINRTLPAAFFADQPAVMSWLCLEALRLWAEHGPDRTLIGPAGNITFVTTALRGDFRTGYRVLRRILAVGEARGFEPGTSQARFLYAVTTAHWFEPLENGTDHARRAREGLLQGGDLMDACWTYAPPIYEFLDWAPSLADYRAEVEAGIAFADRTGNSHAAETFRTFEGLLGVLQGEPAAALSAETVALAGNPTALASAHLVRALAAAILDQQDELERQSTVAVTMLRFLGAPYLMAVLYLFVALSLAGRVRVADPADRGRMLDELDGTLRWLAERTEDAPENYSHLLRLGEAERAWAAGDFAAAVQAFDAARREVATRQRPWHRAFITERAARFYLAHGIEQSGYELLAAARKEYADWGATAKTDQLDRAYPMLARSDVVGASDVTAQVNRSSRTDLAVGAIDVHGVLAASRVLSSETTVDGLRARVVELLSALTGATAVNLLLWNDDEHRWHLAQPRTGVQMTPLDDLDASLLPMSIVRYAERTDEPVIVADAGRDDRFARDPYFMDVRNCSVLALPIHNRGLLQAMLLLENRLLRGAFSAERLDTAQLIAGQLAVSLDNAFVYASLERKVAERTQQLAAANYRLASLSVTDALTGLANRRRLEETLREQWRRAQQTQEPIALAMADIDYFKLYNDHYGHAAGDRCLQQVATVLAGGVREADLVARYGGEEFAIVMPGTGLDTALTVARRLRQTVRDLAVPHQVTAESAVTISIGVAAGTPGHHRTVDNLLEQADIELYRAKRSGRNQVRAAEPRPAGTGS